MERRRGFKRILYRVIAVVLAFCVMKLALPQEEEGAKKDGIAALALGQLENAMISYWCPALSFADQTVSIGGWQVITRQFPILHLYEKENNISLQAESGGTYEEIIRAEGQDEYTDSLSAEELSAPESSDGRVLVDQEMAQLLEKENSLAKSESEGDMLQGGAQDSGIGEKKGETDAEDGPAEDEGAQDMDGERAQAKIPDAVRVEEYQWDFYQKYDELIREFYAVDASTAADSSQLNLDSLLLRDFSIQKRADDEPQILIYHTHSQEDFVNSIPGDSSTTIMGVGEVLTQLLQEQYGYNVMHHLGQYDVENRDYAYNNSLPALEQLLAEYPSIEVVIDVHRDEVAEGTKLVTEIDGRPTAKFMFFNGLSRTRKHGDIEYLPNENQADNLAFSFQMQVLCNEYYPNLTRRIYLKGYRYNMHLKPRYLLIEMGAQTNTYEECYNACIPLAQMLDLELSGADFGYEPDGF